MKRGKAGIDKPMTFKMFCNRLEQVSRSIGRHYKDGRSYPIYVTANGYDLDWDTFQSASDGIVKFNNCMEAVENVVWMQGNRYGSELYDDYDKYLACVSENETN